MSEPTPKAAAFMAANDKSPVKIGTAIGRGGRGGVYTLYDNSQWQLNRADHRSLPKGYPIWQIGKHLFRVGIDDPANVG